MRLLWLLLFAVGIHALVTKDTVWEFMHDWTIQCMLDGVKQCLPCGWTAKMRYPELNNLPSFYNGFHTVCQSLMQAMTPEQLEQLRPNFQVNA